MQKCKAEYYSNLISENKSNPSALWKTLNDITSRKQSSPISCIESDGVTYCDNPSIAKILNVHFSTIGTKLAMKLKSFITLPSPPVRSTDLPKFAFKPITEEFVHGQLKQLRTNKAIGLDNISARLLKDSASVTSKSLTKLFNQSLVTYTFPSLWKFGKVSALFKKGDRFDPSNYRPITVLPTLSKILEKAVHNQLYPFLNDNKIITSKQFGFRPKLSAKTALTHFTDNVLLNMDSGRLTGAVFLDLSKAFDTVNHNLLLHKLRSVGLSEVSVNWFQSYLANRKQRTSVGDTLSVALPITVGVPQGSILGPLLFLIYVNDLPSCQLASEIILYADDTVIYYSSTNRLDLESKLNSDLATISNWFSSNLLTLNISKCNFVIFGNSRRLKLVNDVSLKVNSTAIDRSDSFKYLGVVINQTMSWSEHIDSITTKINQRIGMIKRIRHLLSLHAKLTLYNCLIIPLFDYGDTVWGDKNNDTLMGQLQVLQNKAAKVLLNLPPRSSSTEALDRLDLKTLSRRRHFHRCVMMHKYLSGRIDFNFDIRRNSSFHSYHTRRSNDLHLPRVRTNWGKQTFIYQASKDWNNLDNNIKSSESMSFFKAKLKSF